MLRLAGQLKEGSNAGRASFMRYVLLAGTFSLETRHELCNLHTIFEHLLLSIDMRIRSSD